MHGFTLVFLAALALATAARLWLSGRHIRHIAANRDAVPAEFAGRIPLAAHQKAAAYNITKSRVGAVETLVAAALTLAFTLGGGLQWISAAWERAFQAGGYAHGVGLIASVVVVSAVFDLPFSLYRTFVIEARFGFNRMTLRLFVLDMMKAALIGALIGIPLALVVLLLMDKAGGYWWVAVWLVWAGFNLSVAALYPTLIAPLFNKFSPLEDASLRGRIEALLAKCGFRAKGLFVMDGSTRSSHGNAYFTGIGRHKRIVFFDTLLEHLAHPEVEAVLAHELGHFRLKHVRKRLLLSVAAMFVGLAVLGWLAGQPGFYTALGVPTPSTHAALLLFVLVVPVFTFFVTPLGALWSRRHEFEADAFASSHANAGELATALVKLHRDNASTLTPDPVYAAFYYSHPPPLTRITRLRAAAAMPSA
jgi:STE24 endopeptidase